MPRTGVTDYDLLISGPSDVEKYVNVVKECIEMFNITIGRINNVEIVGRHWSTDSYAQSGGEPQELLNKQFADDCDAAVAIFWSRFGTPTSDYDSGTEEEIEKKLAEGKQVFMYFVDESIPTSELDEEQYNKIKEFREKYKNKGIYFLVKSEEELRKLFTNHLTMHFLPILAGVKGDELRGDNGSEFEIQDYDRNNKGMAKITNSNYVESVFMKNLEKRIIIDFEDANSISLLKREQVKSQTDVLSKELSSELDVPEEWKREMIEFFADHNREIPESFWNVGELKISNININIPFGGKRNLIGTDEEKEHFKDIQRLYKKIKEYNEYRQFFEKIDGCNQLRLVLANNGTTFDEDIDIKIIVPKNSIESIDKIPVPGDSIIKNVIDMKITDEIFKLRKTDEVDAFLDYPALSPTIMPKKQSGMFASINEQLEKIENLSIYNGVLKNTFCYEVYEKEDSDVIVFHVKSLKHNSLIAFPSVLFFKEKPDYIEYEIKSKFNPNVKKGTLKIID